MKCPYCKILYSELNRIVLFGPNFFVGVFLKLFVFNIQVRIKILMSYWDSSEPHLNRSTINALDA